MRTLKSLGYAQSSHECERTHGWWCGARTRPIRCRMCRAEVFWFSCDCGSSVVFDALGSPWPVHDCDAGVIQADLSRLPDARLARGFERRIRELRTVLRHVDVVRGATASASKVHLDSTVLVRDLVSGASVRFTLVIPCEVSPAQGKISVASPVGRALINRVAGDEVQVMAPAGILRLHIEEVSC